MAAVVARKALVTGASRLVGRWVVDTLRRRDVQVRTSGSPGELVDAGALAGVDELYHCAELTARDGGVDDLFRANAEYTRSLWRCAAERGVQRALLLSSTAVYGLASGSIEAVTEDTALRAFEPYGRSKRAAEEAALEVGRQTGLSTVVVRPVAPFGPGGLNPLDFSLGRGAFIHFVLARAARDRRFSFVHVGDIAGAAVHLMAATAPDGGIYNVAVDPPVSVEAALAVYLSVLRPRRWDSLRARAMALVASVLGRPRLSGLLERGVRGLGFTRWRPDLYVVYSARKLAATDYAFQWGTFEQVLASSLGDEEVP